MQLVINITIDRQHNSFRYRNPSVKFSDVYPREEEDDDKTWRGEESWRVNAGKFSQ